MYPSGTHIIADLYDCDFAYHIEKHSLEVIVEHVNSIITKQGFTILGTLHHSFGYNAFSIVCMLAESHVSIHTWPESRYVSFDIYTCNYSRDNTVGTQLIFEELIHMFAPKNIQKEVIERMMKSNSGKHFFANYRKPVYSLL